MELRHLRYFVALAEELHFGRAAQRLGISQPPLSQQIQALERSLDALLFARTNRRVELTEAGRAFLLEARATLEQAERAAAIVGQAQRGEVGEIKIGFTPSAALIAPFAKTILAFRKQWPGVRLVLEERVTMDQIDEMVDRRSQIGFIRSPGRPELPDSIVATELYREPLLVFLRADHRLARGRKGGAIALGALAMEPFVFFPRGIGTSLYDQVIGLCRNAGFRPRIEQEARANATILGLVAAGLGVSILPASLRGVAVANVACRALTAAHAESSIWLVHLRQEQSAASRAFVALATANRATRDRKDVRRR
jgi:DNA-binding transcriptional LysR family regulator